jgi:hypothetical protein
MIAPTIALVVALKASSTPKKTQIPKPLYEMQPLAGGEKLDGSTMVVFTPVLFATAGSVVKAPTPAKKDRVGRDANGPGNRATLVEGWEFATCAGETAPVAVPRDEATFDGA